LEQVAAEIVLVPHLFFQTYLPQVVDEVGVLTQVLQDNPEVQVVEEQDQTIQVVVQVILQQ
jgi:hypothetical protein